MMRLATMLLLAGCATTGTATPVEGPVALGQTAYVGGPTVRPVALVEDSRCPTDVACVWAGRLVVRVVVTTGRGTRTLDLTQGMPVPVADGTLELLSAMPDRRTQAPIDPGDYRFTFAFQGGF